jgi:hypothetical protein
MQPETGKVTILIGPHSLIAIRPEEVSMDTLRELLKEDSIFSIDELNFTL